MLSTQDWLTAKRASYANPQNTYSHMFKPVLYDYIFHRAKGSNVIVTNFFKVRLKDLWVITIGNDNINTFFLLISDSFLENPKIPGWKWF
jgi:hypothetical protein